MELIAFADCYIFLDGFLSRKPNDEDSIGILDLARSNKIKLYTSSSCILNVMYFLKKDGMIRENGITVISQLFIFVALISPGEQAFKNGLLTDFLDLEDAVQYHTAMQVKGIDFFITSNTKDYKKATVNLPVVNPKQFLNQYNKMKS